jgi:acyl-CoA hydrolase
MEGRTARDSMVEMTEIVLPEDSNSRGTIFGGRVLALVDKCAAVAALRHARSEVTTVSFDSVEFRHTVRVGNILVLHGRLNAAFGSSMEIEVEVMAEEPGTGARTLTTRALVTMVALGPEGRPTKAPALVPLDDEDRRRASDAAARRARRLAERR